MPSKGEGTAGPGRAVVSVAIGEGEGSDRERAEPPDLERKERAEAGRETASIPASSTSKAKTRHVLGATGKRSQHEATLDVPATEQIKRLHRCAFPLSPSPGVQKLQPGLQNSGFHLEKTHRVIKTKD